MDTILAFAPHAGIWLHAFPESLILEDLKKQGNRIIYVTCGGEFNSFCTVMQAWGYSPNTPLSQRTEVCSTCQSNAKLIQKHMSFEMVRIDDFLTKDDRDRVDQAVSELKQTNLINWSFEGANLGGKALYEPLLKFKKNRVSFSEDQWSDVQCSFRNTASSYLAARRIIEKFHPQKIMLYNGLYGVNAAVREAAHDIPVLSLHGSANLSKSVRAMMIGRNHSIGWYEECFRLWPHFRHIPIGKNEIDQVMKHFQVLFSGKSVFVYSKAVGSKKSNIRRKFGVQPDQKILVATLSSYDERFGAEAAGALSRPQNLLFPELVDWIKALISWAENNKDVFLLIRPHPRELPNKRENYTSEHSMKLAEALEHLPSNVGVNWPQDNISIYELAAEATAFANAWSSVGAEMTLLGRQVVLYSDELPFYPAELNLLGTTLEEYFKKLREAVDVPLPQDRITLAYRWYYFLFEAMTVDISDSSKLLVREQRPLLERVLYKVEWELGLNFMRRWDLFRRSKNLKETKLNRAWVDLKQDIKESIVSTKYPQLSQTDEHKSIRTAYEELRRMISQDWN